MDEAGSFAKAGGNEFTVVQRLRLHCTTAPNWPTREALWLLAVAAAAGGAAAGAAMRIANGDGATETNSTRLRA